MIVQAIHCLQVDRVLSAFGLYTPVDGDNVCGTMLQILDAMINEILAVLCPRRTKALGFGPWVGGA
jgi:hypothetical protein